MPHFTHDLNLPFAAADRVRRLADYAKSGQALSNEQVLGVAGARVLLANYPALRHDLAPWCAEQSDAWIDQWLLENAAFVSSSQAPAWAGSSPVTLDGRTAPAWRPPRYGRAAVLCAAGSEQVLFDIKGIGVPPDETPQLPHSNGLLTLAEAVHELLMEHLVYAAMQHAGALITPLPAYALIGLGFDAHWHDGRPAEPAVLLLRRACTRPRCQWQRHPQGTQLAEALLHSELLLRRYGLTASSCGAVRFSVRQGANGLDVQRDGQPVNFVDSARPRLQQLLHVHGASPLQIDGVNVQLAGETRFAPLQLQVMDFGRYRFAHQFDNALYSWVDADYQNLNGVYLGVDEAGYTQPAPRTSLADLPGTPAFAALDACLRSPHAAGDGAALCHALRQVVLAARSRLSG